MPSNWYQMAQNMNFLLLLDDRKIFTVKINKKDQFFDRHEFWIFICEGHVQSARVMFHFES